MSVRIEIGIGGTATVEVAAIGPVVLELAFSGQRSSGSKQVPCERGCPAWLGDYLSFLLSCLGYQWWLILALAMCFCCPISRRGGPALRFFRD